MRRRIRRVQHQPLLRVQEEVVGGGVEAVAGVAAAGEHLLLLPQKPRQTEIVTESQRKMKIKTSGMYIVRVL